MYNVVFLLLFLHSAYCDFKKNWMAVDNFSELYAALCSLLEAWLYDPVVIPTAICHHGARLTISTLSHNFKPMWAQPKETVLCSVTVYAWCYSFMRKKVILVFVSPCLNDLRDPVQSLCSPEGGLPQTDMQSDGRTGTPAGPGQLLLPRRIC